MSTDRIDALLTGFAGQPVGKELRKVREQFRLSIRAALSEVGSIERELRDLPFSKKYRIQDFAISWSNMSIWDLPYSTMPGIQQAQNQLYDVARPAFRAYNDLQKPRGFFGRKRKPTEADFKRLRAAQLNMMRETIKWLEMIQPEEDKGK